MAHKLGISIVAEGIELRKFTIPDGRPVATEAQGFRDEERWRHRFCSIKNPGLPCNRPASGNRNFPEVSSLRDDADAQFVRHPYAGTEQWRYISDQSLMRLISRVRS